MTAAVFADLRGASVFITGGGSGIGAALTEGFAAQGARVALVGRSDYTAFAAGVGARTGNTPLALRADITDTDALVAAMRAASDAHGPLSVLVNNAADDTRMAADTITQAMWDDSQAINLRAYFFAAQEAARQMEGRGGVIVNFSSISYMFGLSGLVPYTAANGGITAMTRSLAREWGGRGIRVNAIAPGWVFTEKQERLWATPEGVADFLRRQCIPRKLVPEDIVMPTLFLASAASGAITGQVLPVDAGVVVTG